MDDLDAIIHLDIQTAGSAANPANLILLDRLVSREEEWKNQLAEELADGMCGGKREPCRHVNSHEILTDRYVVILLAELVQVVQVLFGRCGKVDVNGHV